MTTQMVDSEHSSNSEMTLSRNAPNRMTADSTIHSHAKLDLHVCLSTGRCPDEPAQAECQLDKERFVPDMYELESNDIGENVVKEANFDLAVNFSGVAFAHLGLTSVCVRL